MMPPAIRNAGVVIPYRRMIQEPSAVTAISTTTAVMIARWSVLRRRASSYPAVIAR